MATVELYEPQELIAALRESEPMTGFFRQLFRDSDEFKHGTTDFLLDKVEGTVGISTYVERKGEYVKVDSEGYKTNLHKPGYIKEVMTLTPDDLLQREAGVGNLLGSQNPGNKLQMKIGEQFAKLTARKERLEEQQASQGLTTGTVTISGKGVQYVADFGLKASHKITPTVLWGVSATAKPVDDLEDAVDVIMDEAAGLGANIGVIMSSDSWRAFKSTTQVKEELDNRRMEIGKIAPKMRNGLGAKYRGFFEGIGEVWTYSRKYKDKDGNVQNYMPEKTVIVIDLDARLEAHYGVITNMKAPAGGWKTDMFPMTFGDEKGTVIENTLESAPLMSPIQTNGYCVLTVLA